MNMTDQTWISPALSSRFIADNAEHVKINRDHVDKLAQLLAQRIVNNEFDITKWKSDNPMNPQQMTEQTVDWIFVVDSLNFSFWPDEGFEFTIENQVGYWALVCAINRAQANGISITDSKWYKDISIEQARNIFAVDGDSGLTIPMLEQRVQILNQNGQILVEKFGGSFVNCIKQCNSSATNLLKIIYNNFPSFRDESIYKNKKVTFLKRAQILVADIWACFEGKGLGLFNDIDELTMFADYRIPQALHYFDVLVYSNELMEQLKKDKLLENGSQFEVEIRGASIWAVELIKERIKNIAANNEKTSTHPNSIQIDFFLWGYRRDFDKQIGVKSPYHRVRSIFY